MLVTHWDGCSLRSITIALCDFGFARFPPTSTSCATFVGAAMYLAPEAWRASRGLEGYGPPAGACTAGVSLCILAAGVAPWGETSSVEACATFDDVELAHLRDSEVIDAALQPLLQHSMLRNAADRAHASLLWNGLAHFVF